MVQVSDDTNRRTTTADFGRNEHGCRSKAEAKEGAMGRVGCRWLLVKSARDEDQPTSDRAGALIDGADHAVNEQAHGEAAEHGKPARDRIARVSRRGNIADPRNAGDRDKRDRHDAKDRQSGVPGRRRGTLRH